MVRALSRIRCLGLKNDSILAEVEEDRLVRETGLVCQVMVLWVGRFVLSWVVLVRCSVEGLMTRKLLVSVLRSNALESASSLRPSKGAWRVLVSRILSSVDS